MKTLLGGRQGGLFLISWGLEKEDPDETTKTKKS